MSNPHLDKWENRFLQWSQQQWSNPQTEQELLDNQHFLDGKGLALDLACGSGANALYLSTLGYSVVACDGAFNGIKICDILAKKLCLSLLPVVCDLHGPAIKGRKYI